MTQLKSRQKSAEVLSMKTQNAEWKFLITTAFIVATIAVPTLASLFSADVQDVPEMALKASEQKVRQPSSLPMVGTAKKAVVISDAGKELANLVNESSISYNFKCDKTKTTEFKVQGNYVQLKGHDCEKNSDLPKLSITNKTNGFTASVFFLAGKNYQTDLIQLKEGVNQIHIQYQAPNGKLEEHTLSIQSGKI